MLMKILQIPLLLAHSTPPPHHILPSQAKGAEAVSIPAKFEDGPGPDGGGRPEHRHGLGGEAEGGAALLRVREAILHQRAGARCAHELLMTQR